MALNVEAASKYHRLLIVTYGIGVLVTIAVRSLTGQSGNTGDDAVSPWFLLLLPIVCLLSYFSLRLARAIGASGIATAILDSHVDSHDQFLCAPDVDQQIEQGVSGRRLEDRVLRRREEIAARTQGAATCYSN
ncbi:MAG: hypothetical protein JSR26_03530 [Proteobacteria bacterium]|nr:hypothetical protein [Pseudomonadota bacterium]